MEVTIRQATAQDADAAERLFQAHLNWINVWFDHHEVIQRPVAVDRQRSMFEEHQPCAVAEIDGTLVGFVCSEQNNPRILDLWNLYVDDAYRGRGIATRLIQEIEKIARQQDIDTIMSTVSAYFFPGKKLPESLFRRLDYEVHDIADGAHLYIKRLSETSKQKSSKKVRRLRFSSNELLGD